MIIPSSGNIDHLPKTTLVTQLLNDSASRLDSHPLIITNRHLRPPTPIMPFSFFRPDGPPRSPGSNGSFSSFSASSRSDSSSYTDTVPSALPLPQRTQSPSSRLSPTFAPAEPRRDQYHSRRLLPPSSVRRLRNTPNQPPKTPPSTAPQQASPRPSTSTLSHRARCTRSTRAANPH